MTTSSVVVVDIGATKTYVTVRSLGELANGWMRGGSLARTASDLPPDELVEWVVRQVAVLMSPADSSIAAIGVAAPGPLDAASGVITRSSNLGWDDVPIAALFEERFGAPVSLEDDANCAALGEWRWGAGSGADPMGYLTVSSGIGGAVITGGDILRGAGGNAGEVGHLIVDSSGPPCACGRRGDVESYAGGASLARRARRTWPRRTLSTGLPSPRDASGVFKLARTGDTEAQSLVADAANALAAAIAAMTAVVEPRVIVVGGSIGLGQRRLLRRATALARRRVLRESAANLRVLPAALGHESVLVGAAALALRGLDRGSD